MCLSLHLCVDSVILVLTWNNYNFMKAEIISPHDNFLPRTNIWFCLSYLG